MKTIQFGDYGAFGKLIKQDILELKAECEKEVNKWKEIPARINDEPLKRIADDQATKWTFLFKILSDRLASSIELNYLHGLIGAYAKDMDLVRADGDFAQRLIRGGSENIETKLPRMDDYSAVEARAATFTAALAAMLALVDQPDPREFHVRQTDDLATDLYQKLERIGGRIDQLDKQSESGSVEVDRRSTKAQQEIAERQEQVLNAISIAGSQTVDAFKEKVVAFERAAIEYQSLLDAAKNTEVLELPMRRWKAQERKHGKNAAQRVKIAAALALTTIILTPFTVFFILNQSWRYFPFEYLGLPRLIFSGVTGLMVLTFGLWATRIAVRSYMAEEHLKNDCANRVGITNAFIKLQASMGASEEEKKILLNTIMRPAQDGIVHDDGLPNGHPASLLVQLLDPKRGTGS